MERKFNDQEIIRRNKLKELQDQKQDPFTVEYVKRTCTIEEFCEKNKKIKAPSKVKYTLAGRVLAIRQTFGKIVDFSGEVQFYINIQTAKENLINYFKKYLDVGDIVEIIGTPFKTKKGELTINVEKLRIVTKALKPLPEKWHGLQDEELRARHRYVDLIMNEESMHVFVQRSLILKYLRNYYDDLGYFEVETPILHPRLGGANARPFITHHNTLKRDYFLRVATELSLKKAIVGGFEKVYEIGRCFRNEGMDSTHNPEFTSVEGYTAYASMEDVMKIVENTFKFLAKKLKKPVVVLDGNKIDLTKKFKVIHIADFVKEVTGVDFSKIKDVKEALRIAKEKNVKVEKHQRAIGHILNLFFEEFCEEKCIQPTFVWGHPIEVSPLAKKDYTREGYTRRFELFINKKEYANAFAELNDPIDQLERFEEQVKEKELGNDEANEIDMDFVESLEYGLPPTGGFGIGIDRLVMLFCEKSSIRDVLLFPHMKDK
ncbi:MAG: lysine--tRNA ligase [Mycoplasmoidaceae bacterium]